MFVRARYAWYCILQRACMEERVFIGVCIGVGVGVCARERACAHFRTARASIFRYWNSCLLKRRESGVVYGRRRSSAPPPHLIWRSQDSTTAWAARTRPPTASRVVVDRCSGSLPAAAAAAAAAAETAASKPLATGGRAAEGGRGPSPTRGGGGGAFVVGGRRLHPGRSQIKGMVDGPRRRKAEARQRPTVTLEGGKGALARFPPFLPLGRESRGVGAHPRQKWTPTRTRTCSERAAGSAGVTLRATNAATA